MHEFKGRTYVFPVLGHVQDHDRDAGDEAGDGEDSGEHLQLAWRPDFHMLENRRWRVIGFENETP